MLKKTMLIGTSVLAATTFMATAQAQNDEIIVTATKREQTLNEVPVSVSVTDAETVEQARILDILDLQSVVPSLRVSQLQNSAQTSFIIRGFGNGANNAGIEPSVAVFIDGVYRSRSQAQISDLPNIERIEVLRGPQSTLFGKNASAGVISVVTSKPEFEWDGYIEGGIGNYDSRTARAYFTGPLSDTIAFSVGGSYNKRDGYTTNQATGNDVSDRDRYALRGQLLFEPADTMSFRLVADYDKLDEICCTVTNFVDGPTGDIVRALGGAIPQDPFSYNVFLNFEPTNEAENKGLSLDADFDLDWAGLKSITALRSSEIVRDGDVDFNSADLIGSNAQFLEIETFTQEFRLTSQMDGPISWILGGFYFDESIKQGDSVLFGTQFRPYADFLTGAPGTIDGVEASLSFAPGTFFRPGDGVMEFATQENESYSIFAQADWELSDRLTATVGVSYLNDQKEVTLNQLNTDVFSQLDFAGQDGFNSLVVQGIAANFPNIALACTGTALPFTPANVQTVSGVGSCPFLPGTPPGALAFAGLQAQVTAGVSALDLSDPNQNPLLGLQALQFLPQLLGFPNAGQDGRSDDSNTDYTIRLAYDLTDDINVYGSYSTGYKATSWNLSRDSRPTSAEIAAIQSSGGSLPNNLTTGTRFAGPEESEVFEIGLKAQFDRGSVNLAVFDQTIEGFQSNTFTGAAFTLANAGEQSVQGLEIDALWYPTENLEIMFGGTFLDPEYDSFTASPLGDISGTKPGGIHETSLSTAATWSWERGPYSGFVRGNWVYDSDVTIQDGGAANPANQILATTDSDSRAVSTFNASVGISRENIDVLFWSRNLFNDEYRITNFPTTAQPGSFSGYPSQPRTYGVTVKANLN